MTGTANVNAVNVADETRIWPRSGSQILNWLMQGTHKEADIENIFVDLCHRLCVAGIPLARASLHFRTHHPQWLGSRTIWRRGEQAVEVQRVAYHIQETSAFRDSPFRAIVEGADMVRQRLLDADAEKFNNTLYDELRSEGLTDYLALPLVHTLGKRHLVTFSSDARDGFDESHILFLTEILPALALVSEIRVKNQLAQTLLETYVGPHASEKILDGATTRGSGVTVDAAILICDLRNFTSLSSSRPRDEVIGILNEYFDAMAAPIEKNGGEILKFMGDGLLAIFPLSNPTACADLLAAVEEAQRGMERINIQRRSTGAEALGYGVGIHVGDVMYGNIGSQSRLDFTVIGPAVNLAARLESLTKELHRPVLLSQAFVDMAGCESRLANLGAYSLKGVPEPVVVFAVAE